MRRKIKFILFIIGLFSLFIWLKFQSVRVITDDQIHNEKLSKAPVTLTYKVRSEIVVFDKRRQETLRSRYENFELQQHIFEAKHKKALSIFSVKYPAPYADISAFKAYAQKDTWGRIEKLNINHKEQSTIDPWVRHYLEIIISRLQISLPKLHSKPPRAWRQIEKDQYGNYIAIYKQELQSDSRHLHIKKTIKSYNQNTPLNHPSLLPNPAVTVENHEPLAIKIRKKDFIIESLSGTTIHEIKQDNIDYRVTHKLKIELIDSKLTKENFDYEKILASLNKPHTPKKWQTSNFKLGKDFLNIHDLIAQNQDTELNQLFSEAVDHYNHFPEQLVAVKEKIVELNESDKFYKKKIAYLTGILAEQNSPAVESILVELLDHKNENILIQSLAALADLKHPSEYSTNGLINFNESVASTDKMRNQAQLSLGTISYKLRKNNQNGHKDSSNYLATLSKTLLDDEKISIIDALGNDGALQHLEFIKPFLYHQENIIRARAIYQLRKMSSPQTFNIFHEVLKKESDVHVWQEGLKALQYKQTSILLVETLYTLIKYAPTPEMQFNYSQAMMEKGGCCIETVEKNLNELYGNQQLRHLRKDIATWINHITSDTKKE